MKSLLLLSITLCLGCQPQATIRDARAYRLEALFFKKAVDEQHKIVTARLKAECCVEGKFKGGAECESLGEVYAVVHTSAQHHYDRMMFLGGFAETDPGSLVEPETQVLLGEVCRD